MPGMWCSMIKCEFCDKQISVDNVPLMIQHELSIEGWVFCQDCKRDLISPKRVTVLK